MEIDLVPYFERAQNALKACLANEQNQHVVDELGCQIEKLSISNEFVSFRFDGIDSESCASETRLNLLSEDGRVVGYYCYHVDGNGVAVDDFLVFD